MNAPPDPPAIVHAVLTAVPDDLRAAEAVLDAVISALCLHLVRIQARIAANAPVARVTDDLLAQIFTHACRALRPDAATSATAAAIAGTSRRWRGIMLAHPALWTRVDLRHPGAASALRCSRRLGLHVRLDAPLWKERDGQLARILAPHLPRLRQLWIQTGAIHAEAFLRGVVAAAPAAPSQLERLTLTGRYTDEHPIALPSFPRLRHLALTHAHLAPTPLPQGLLTLSLKPPPAAPTLALAVLAALLRASPGLTELSLYGGAVPVFRPNVDEPLHDRTELPRLRSLRVAGVGPVQVAWLLFHITYPASANLTIEMDAPRPMRTAEYDKPHPTPTSAPRPPNELESYLAALSLFSGEPRERGMPLDTIFVGPAAAVSPPLPNPNDKHASTTTEKLAAQYTTPSGMLTLQAGSRATEVLVRLIAGGGSVGGVGGPSAGMGGMSKLVLSGVKFRLSILEAANPNPNPDQGGLSQVRMLEIRACSLVPKGDGPFATPIVPQRPIYASPTHHGFSIPPTPARQYSAPPTPHDMPSTPAQQESAPSTPTLGPTHTPRPPAATANSAGSHTHGVNTNGAGGSGGNANSYVPVGAGNTFVPSLGLGLGTSYLGVTPNAPTAPSPLATHIPNPLLTHVPIPSALATHVPSPLATRGSSPQGSNTPIAPTPLTNLHIPTYVSGSGRLAQAATPPSTSSNKPNAPESERNTPVFGDAARRRESGGTVRASAENGGAATRRKSGGEKSGNMENASVGEKVPRASSDGAVRVSTAAAVRALSGDLVRASSSVGVVRVPNGAAQPSASDGGATRENRALGSEVDEVLGDSAKGKAEASGSVYSEDTAHASAGTGSDSGSTPASESEDEGEGEGKTKDKGTTENTAPEPTEPKPEKPDAANSPKKDEHALTNAPVPTPEDDKDAEPITPTDDNPLSPMSSSSDGTRQPNADESEEDETDSNEADGGSEFGHLTIDDSGDEGEGNVEGTRTPSLGRARDRPGTPGPRAGSRGKRGSSTSGTKSGSTVGTKTETIGSTSSVNGGTTPRMSGTNTPLISASGSGSNTPQMSGAAPPQKLGATTPANPHLHNLRTGLHSASMSNLRAAAQSSTASLLQNSASSSNLRAAFTARPQSMHAPPTSDSNTPTPTNATPQNSFAGPSLNAPRGRSTVPTPKQGAATYGFASYATGTSATGFGAGGGSVPPNGTSMHSSSRPSFSSAQTYSGRPSFSTNQPSASSSLPTTQHSFNTFRSQRPSVPPPQDEDPDIGLLSALSFHMPSLEEIRIVRSTVRGSALVRFIEARNGSSEGYRYGHESALSDNETDWDSESGSESDLERGIAMGKTGPGVGVKRKKAVRAGAGAPILSLELIECPYVNVEHVRALRESVDDVRWKPYTFVGASAASF